MGILLATVCILFAGAVAWSFVSPIISNTIDYKDFVGLALGTATSFVTFREIRKRSARTKLMTKPFHLSPSFDSGLFGGFVGGAIAGVCIGVGYYVQFGSSDETLTAAIIPEIFLFSSFVGLVLGGTIQLFILWFRHLASENQYSAGVFNEVIGGVLGGIISGIFVGALAILFFGFRHENFVGIVPLVTGAIFGVVFIATGALFYDYGGRWQNVTRAFVASLLVTAFTATAGIVILQFIDVEKWVYATSSTVVVGGGIILGAVICALAGFQVGLTLIVYRLWEVTEQ